MSLVAYLCHPVGPGMSPSDLEARQNNIASALTWLRWLVDTTPWAISAPWLPYVQSLEEGTYRPRGLRDNLTMLERCDVAVMCGGRISEGMVGEKDHALKHGIPVIDFTTFGAHPTALQSANAAAALALRTYNAVKATPRRVWLPPITKSDLQSLRATRASLTMNQHLPDAIEYLGKVIAAAEERP